MKHDDIVGEEITADEEFMLKASIMERVTGQPYHDGLDLRFPGSQPVSLARSNIDMLNIRRYWVTWKVPPTSACLTHTFMLPKPR